MTHLYPVSYHKHWLNSLPPHQQAPLWSCLSKHSTASPHCIIVVCCISITLTGAPRQYILELPATVGLGRRGHFCSCTAAPDCTSGASETDGSYAGKCPTKTREPSIQKHGITLQRHLIKPNIWSKRTLSQVDVIYSQRNLIEFYCHRSFILPSWASRQQRPSNKWGVKDVMRADNVPLPNLIAI